ncbi:MAG: 2-oxo acid dehydrogenase subunit E2 [Ruminococcaceae bacterium]|nr:2-oxo acid dehydrogenase subunit E2 [Oscillospiraceae bacterium]
MGEGRRIKSSIPMDAVSPFIMPTRTGASNVFFATIDIEKCEALIKQKRADGMTGLGMIHFFMASYVRVVSQLPGINRFIRGQRLFARNGIEICMVMKKEMKLNAPETVLKLELAPKDTIETIYHQLCEAITENRQIGDQNNMDTAARVLVHLPSIVLKFTVWLLKLMDYFGLLPRFLTKLSPFHGSMFITNMGSLGMPPIVHHLYNFGNLPLFIAMGAKRTEYEITKDGTAKKRRVIDCTITCDERICDGHYYACAFKKFQRFLENPELLLSEPEMIYDDIR